MKRLLLFLITALPNLAAGDTPFTVNLPQGWTVQKLQQGYVRMESPDKSRFVLVRPILGRTADCQESLRRAFAASWSAFPGARNLEVSPSGRGIATARFSFQDGRSRGAVMCAETSSGTGMYYGLAAPASSFGQDLAGLVGILRSFRYGGGAGGGPSASGPATLPRMVNWQEPHEMAYTLQVPEGWRMSGGLTRIDVTHARSGFQMDSPDGKAMLRIGDPRLQMCTVPGPGAMRGQGEPHYCPYQTGGQAGQAYLTGTLAREWQLEGLQIVSNQARPELSETADRLPRQMGLNVKSAFGEIRFRATRQGSPVEVMILANTQMLASVPGQNFVMGTYYTEFTALAGPPSQFGQMTAIAGHVIGTIHWNIQWWQREQRIGAEVARQRLAAMHAQAEEQQKSFWARMDASDRRRDAVNDILGGTVRLSDGEGHTYDAKAGSNYYFLDTDAARRAGKPNDAVVGGDLYPSPMVDLRPLEVIR